MKFLTKAKRVTDNLEQDSNLKILSLGFIGYSVTINDVYTPSGTNRPEPTAGRLEETEITS